MSMALSKFVHHLGSVVIRDSLTHLPDSELLRRYTSERDPVAFEALVWRHGVMVLGVCGRLLGRTGDMEDAFQATFLTLVRHASAVRGDSLAGWLYRVARRVSVKAARQRARRSAREQVVARKEAVISDNAEWSDWRAFLDRELERLPARYREAFVLCHLEGRAHEDAARELGCPVGTLHSRLARAKKRLRIRLAAYGVAIPLVVPGTVSARLVAATVHAATGLTDGAMDATATAAVALSQGGWKPMVFFKSKFVMIAMLAVAAAGTGIGMVNQPAANATAIPGSEPSRRAEQEPTIEELKRENKRLRIELSDLKQQLKYFEGTTDYVPADAEVIKALPKPAANTSHDDFIIVKNKIVDRVEPMRFYPSIGNARLWLRHWECKVYYTQIKELPGGEKQKKSCVHVVYIDKDTLVLVAEIAK